MNMQPTIIAFPAAVNLDFVQKSGGFGSDPQPQAPLVISLYLVVKLWLWIVTFDEESFCTMLLRRKAGHCTLGGSPHILTTCSSQLWLSIWSWHFFLNFSEYQRLHISLELLLTWVMGTFVTSFSLDRHFGFTLFDSHAGRRNLRRPRRGSRRTRKEEKAFWLHT